MGQQESHLGRNNCLLWNEICSPNVLTPVVEQFDMEHPLSVRALEVFDGLFPITGERLQDAPESEEAMRGRFSGNFVTGAGTALTDDRLKPERREVWSFFTGAMGLDLGLEKCGLHPTLCNEINPLFCDTIRANRPKLEVMKADAAHLDAAVLRKRRSWDGEVFLMVGGPPCQSFSSGGKRAGLSDPRGNLIYEYVRLVAEVRPRYFVLENVANLTTAALRHRPIAERPGKHWNLKLYERRSISEVGGPEPLQPDELAGSALRQILADMRDLGYHVSFAVVDAADYGAPQHRLRFVMIGSRDCPPPALPEPTHGRGRLPYVTVRDAIANLQAMPGEHSEYTVATKRFFELVPQGGNWRSLPPSLQCEAMGGAFLSGGGKTGFFRRLHWDAPSPTVTGRANRKASALCHPAVSRPLSVRECAALQGFPDDWMLCGAMNNQYLQVGNAVPVQLGYAIGQAIISHEAVARGRRMDADWAVEMEVMLVEAQQRLRSAARNKRSLQSA